MEFLVWQVLAHIPRAVRLDHRADESGASVG